tara:strand:+ start:801 stop:1076 length:276 start_codon:yes stop_codon:yes gene_type:complete
MYCCECSSEVHERAKICPVCGCNPRGITSDLAGGTIAGAYLLAVLFPIFGLIAALYLACKKEAAHGVVVAGVSLLSMVFSFFLLASSLVAL